MIRCRKKKDSNSAEKGTIPCNCGGKNSGGWGLVRGHGGWNNNNRAYCQLCGKPGHVACKCVFFFFWNMLLLNVGTGLIKLFRNPKLKHKYLLHHVANSKWLFGSRATNHLTAHMNHFAQRNELEEINQLWGNSQGLQIFHPAYFSFKTPFELHAPCSTNSQKFIKYCSNNRW